MRAKSVQFLIQHLIKTVINRTPSSRVRPICSILLNHDFQGSRLNQLNKSYKPVRFTLQSQVPFSLSSYIDLCTWHETLIQVQQDVLAISQMLLWPKRAILSSITTLDSKLSLMQNAFQGQGSMLITSDKSETNVLPPLLIG